MHASSSSPSPTGHPGRTAAVLIGTAGLAVAFAPLAHSAAFTAGNIAVLQADSASANNTTATIVELNPALASQSPTNTIAISASGANALRISGSATSTGYLANSNDRTLLCFSAHNSTSTSGNANTLTTRGVGTLDPTGAFVLPTTYTGVSGNQTRCATSLNNSTWIVGDQGGIYSNGTSTASPSGNFRGVKSFGGTAYVFQASASLAPVGTLSAATGGTVTALPGLPVGDTSKQDFYLVSSGDNGTAYDVLYVLTATSGTAGTIAKYSLVSGSCTANGSYTTSFGGFGLAAADNGNGALLYVSTGTGATAANNVLKLADTAGYNATISITTASNVTLYTAPAGTTVKGVAFAPVAIPLSAPAIGSHPSSTTITSGGTATLTVSASGNPTPTYQWYQGASGDTSNPVSGATSASFTTPALTTTTTYWARATNSQGSANSNAATVTVSNLTNADLTGLTLSTGTLSPVFAAATTTYTVNVANGTSGITITPTKSDVNATITVNGTAVTSGTASGNIPLSLGDNTATVVVTAPNGTTTRTYTVTINRDGPTLATGAIAFTGFNADGNDDLAFVALADIPAGTQIYFNDNEWNGSAIGSGGAFNTGESEYRWTAPAGGVAAGTIVTLNSISGTITASAGSVVYTDATNPGVSTSADTIYAFQGTPATPTLFLASITTGTGVESEIGGTGLTAGSTAVVLTASADGARYKGVRAGQATFAGYLSLIGNVAANWEDVGNGDGTTYLPFSTTAFTTGSAPASVTINDVSVTEGNSGTATLTFTVTRSDNTGAFTVDYATANGTATAGSDYTAASGTLTFTAGGALTQAINVTVTGDTTVESDETLVVNLTNLVNTTGTASIGDAQGTGTIVTDDFAPTAPYTSANRDVLVPNTGTWPAGGVSLGSTQFVNLGLQGVGRFPANSIDPATGESLGSISDMQVTNFVNHNDGTWTGTFNFLPDRGYNSGSIFSNYAARINAFNFTFTPYTGSTPITAQNQVAMTFAGSTRFTYDHDGNAGTAPVFTTGLNADSQATLFGTTVPAVAGATIQSDGTVTNRLTLDSEGLVLDRRSGKAGSGWVGDEYGGYIYHFNASKQIDGQLQLPAALIPHKPVGTVNFNGTPTNGRRDNQGMEGIAQSPDGAKVFGLMQSATIQDSGSGNQGRSNTRLLVYDVSGSDTPSAPVAQYLIQLPRAATTTNNVLDRNCAQSSILALNDHQLLILSRDGNGRGASGSPVFKSILLADISGATNINGSFDAEAAAVAPGGVLNASVTPITWSEALNLIGRLDLPTAEVAKFGLNLNAAPGDINTICEKWEALGLVPANDPAAPNDFFLFVGNDNDFLTSGGKYLDASGTVQSYDGGLENDTLVLAYRVRIVAPDISVHDGASATSPALQDAQATPVDFGTVDILHNVSRTFTIQNSGTSDLTGLTVTVDGTNASDFTVTTAPVAPVTSGSTTTVVVRFAPGAIGSKSATLHIASNAPGSSASFDIPLSGIATLPPITFLGVASGDNDSSHVTLWTRVEQAVTVNLDVQVSTSPAFSGTPLSFSATSDPAANYTAKAAVSGLTAGTTYYYRFVVVNGAGETSGTGTFKTAPAPNAAVPLKFAFSGDMDGLMRPYALASTLPAQSLDFYVNLGDVIYETASNVAGNAGTSNLNSPAVTLSGSIPAPSATGATQAQLLSDYYKKYREQFLPVNTGGQSCLKDFYAGQANYMLYDNHELGNRQYINGGAAAGGAVGDMASGAGVDARVATNDVNTSGTFMNQTPGFLALQKVFVDYMPIADRGLVNAPSDPRMNGTRKFYFSQPWGKNATYFQVDDRTYRDIRMKTSANADDTGSRAANPNRTMLGVTQLAWLKQALLDAQTAGTRWKFIAISDPIDQLGPIGGALTGTLTAVKSDGGKSWQGGYRAERNDLLKFIADHQITNVVFLATDDHQNRINELTYSPTSQTEVQSSYVKVPYCFSIVCGPLGATGPDSITDHSIANITNIANSLANAQTNAGLEPVGIGSYPGLKNLTCEGDPTAGSNPKPVDFYSPDTFNYNTLQVSADGKTLTVTSIGITATAQNSALEYGANGNTARTIFSFQIEADATPFDVWKLANFGTTDPSGNTANNGDFDSDGVSNLLEYAFGTDPRATQSSVAAESNGTVTSHGMPTPRIATNPNSVDYRGIFARRLDRNSSGLNYTPQFSHDLSTWFNSSATPSVLASDSEVEIVSVPFPFFLPDGKKARFFRVQVTAP